MVNVLRRWSQPIMVLVTVLIIVSFSYFGPAMRNRSSGERVAVQLYGKDVTVDDFTRQARRVGIYAVLRGSYYQAIEPFSFGKQPDNGTVARSFVLEHEADEMGITS